MENFKEIAEKCLAGELNGTFVLRNGKVFHSKTHLSATSFYTLPYCIAGWCYSVVGNCYSKSLSIRDNDVIDFIPNNMQKKVEIDIPEGKVPVMEQTENGVVVTWKDKELTYKDIESKIILKNTRDCSIGYTPVIEDIKTLNCQHSDFYKKVEVLRKLTNIRNYFGKPNSYDRGYCVSHSSSTNTFYVGNVNTIGIWPKDIIFAKQEHAEQAIKMLGDELKYLFEPW